MNVCRKTGLFLAFCLISSLPPQWAFSNGKMPPEDEEEDFKPPQAEQVIPDKIKQPEEAVKEQGVSQEKVKAQTEPLKQETVPERAVPEKETEPAKASEVPLTKYPPEAVVEEITPNPPEGSKIHTVWIWQD